MSFLEDLINEMDKAKQPKEQKQAQDKLSKFYEFEKNLRELAKSKGLQPRTFLEQLVAAKPELANNKIIQKLLGEQDVPTQKGRDAKRDVLTPKAMNTVKQGIKQAAKKHAAVESAINALEVHGLNKCFDHGIDGFKRYIALSVVARNIHRIGDILHRKEQKRMARRQRSADSVIRLAA